MKTQLIRLILTQVPEIDSLSLSIGLSEARFEEIGQQVFDILCQTETMSQAMQKVTETFFEDAELALALYILGMLKQKSVCDSCKTLSIKLF